MNAWLILGPLLVAAAYFSIRGVLRSDRRETAQDARMRDMVRPWRRAGGAWVDRPVVYLVGAALAASLVGGLILISGYSQTVGI